MRCGDVMVSTSKIAHVRQVLFADADVLSVITHLSGFWGHILEQRRPCYTACYAAAPLRSFHFYDSKPFHFTCIDLEP